MNNGAGFRIKMIFGQVFRNRLRFFLSVFGIFLPIFLTLTIYILADSAYYSEFEDNKWLKENGILTVNIREFSEGSDEFAKLTHFFGDRYLGFKNRAYTVLEYPVRIKGEDTFINLQIVSSNINYNGSIVLRNNGIDRSRLIDGRGFDRKDIENRDCVVIIGNSLAKALHGKEYLGKTLELPYITFIEERPGVLKRMEKKQAFSIIGTYDDTPDFLPVETNGMRIVTESVYIPWNVSLSEKNEDVTAATVVFGNVDELEPDQLNYLKWDGYVGSYSDYDTVSEIIRDANRSRKTAAGLVAAILGLLSVFMIGQTLLFSVKEQLPEFGIKRALGAGAADVALDIVAEVFAYTIIAFVIAVLFSLTSTLLILNYSGVFGFPTGIRLVVKGRSLLLAGLLAMFTGLSAAIFPLVYLSKKNIEEIIRFE